MYKESGAMGIKKNRLIVLVLLLCTLISGCSDNYSSSNNEKIANGNVIFDDNSFKAVIIDKTEDAASLNNISEYNGSPYISLNGNMPYFTEKEKSSTEPFEHYSNLDSLGRCGVAFANICKEIMPTEQRGAIGQVRPSGWHTVKYNGIVDGNYLYNRCHLIGYQLAGENANELNLITGTRYMNMIGMQEFENVVSAYVEETNNHVLYRVTPIFEGENLVAKGVEMEAWSVEDKGVGICFNIFCYNVQPGIEIDYATGDSWLSDGDSAQEDRKSDNYTDENLQSDKNTGTQQEIKEYILNKNTKKFHLPSCSSVNSMSENNKQIVYGTIDDIKKQGYTPCSRCLGMYK